MPVQKPQKFGLVALPLISETTPAPGEDVADDLKDPPIPLAPETLDPKTPIPCVPVASP